MNQKGVLSRGRPSDSYILLSGFKLNKMIYSSKEIEEFSQPRGSCINRWRVERSSIDREENYLSLRTCPIFMTSELCIELSFLKVVVETP